MPFSIRKHDGKYDVVNSETGDVKGSHTSEDDAKKQLAALYANDADKDKGHMDIQLKSMTAVLEPQQDGADSGPGTFHAIISTERRDRDGDQLWADEWETPLPEHIQIVGDHDNHHIMSTVGSGAPTLEGDKKIHVRGSYATTRYAQDARKLVNGKHLRTLSVAYREKRGEKGVTRELVNASFVNVPSNLDAVVLESKSAVKPSDMPGAKDNLTDEAKSFIQDVVKETLSAADAVNTLLEGLGLEVVVDERDSIITVKNHGKVLGAHKFSQAPEAPPNGADSAADQAKNAIARGKAVAMAMQTRHLINEED